MTKCVRLCLLFCLLMTPFGLYAQQSPPSSPTTKQMLERIQVLEQQVAVLQKKLQILSKQVALASRENAPPTAVAEKKQEAPKQSAPSPAVVALQVPPALPRKAAAPPQVQVASSTPGLLREEQIKYPNLAIHGFADVDFSAQDHRAQRVGTSVGFTPPGTSSGFDLGQFVLHFAGALAPRVSYFAELSWTATPTGYQTEVERTILRYDFNDYLKISAGRFHTPINYWNTAFHHGLWLQTSISRPEMIQFGGRLIPVHFVGALAQGLIPKTGSLNLHYDVGIGNGRSDPISRAGDSGDVNNSRAWLTTIYAKPFWAYGLRFGGSLYRDKVRLVGDGSYREWIEAAHVVYTKEDPEILAEIANIHHQRIGGPGTYNSLAWYVQVGYRLPWWQQKWKPYYRFEYIHVPKSDPVFNPPVDPLPSLAGWLIGVRYDFTSYAALKMEYRHARRFPHQPRVNGLFLQSSLTF